MEESELRQAVAALETSRAQMDALARQEEMLRLSLEEYVRARETMARYADTPVGTQILVPIGANSFLFASVDDVDKCIVGIGSEVALEDTLERAMERLDNRIRQLQDVQEGLLRRIEEIGGKVNEYTAAVQRAYEKSRSERGEESGV
ncbi:MAG: prefoldin subunit alpha [Thermoplasmata archaeon]